MVAADARLQALWWDGVAIRYVDQRLLPQQYVIATAATVASVVEAIRTGGVHGCESVDVFGAFGVALAGRASHSDEAVADAVTQIRAAAGGGRRLAIDRVAATPREAAISEAQCILAEQRDTHTAIAANALALLPHNGNVLTHGSTGALATAGFGTAQGAIIAAARAGKQLHVFVCEGRPTLSGTRVTAFEFERAGVPVTLIADGAAAWVVRSNRIAAVIVGAAAIAANGDAIGQIGTYGIALAAAHHGVPFYVAAARATVNVSLANGDAAACSGQPQLDIASVSNADPKAVNATWPEPRGEASGTGPLHDVTPGRFISAMITEYGVTKPPYHEALAVLMSRPAFAMVDRAARIRASTAHLMDSSAAIERETLAGESRSRT